MTSANGITNIDIEIFFENETNDDLKRNFVGGYSSDLITKYINFYDIIKERRAKHPFSIFNTDRENKPGTHCWSFFGIHPRKDFLLFDSFRFAGFKQIIVDNNESLINKMLFNLEQFNKKDLESLIFSIESCNKIKETSRLENLINTAKDFFHLLPEFAKLKKKQKKKMKIILLDEQPQQLTRNTCGIFQLYFCKNLFDPARNSKIINDEFLTKKTVTTLLNEIFSTNKESNGEKMKEFAKDNDL